jgi:succinate-semialdehyde dehydrogenase/glutarate-semialdehyde dehydrogenase
MPITTINPATGATLEIFEPLSDEALERKLALAESAFRQHRRTPFAERAARMVRAAEILEAEKEDFARTMTTEMGKTFASALAEVEKCARACRYYAENAERFLADEEVQTEAARSLVRYQPLGPVLAVMPWNFPFWQVFRFAAPGLMAGNVGLLKHASNVPRCALAIESVFLRAGFPEGVFQTLLIGSDRVQRVLDDPRVVAATLTGSTPAGSAVAERAGKRLKKTVLELGGSDPFVVMPSTDLEGTARMAAQARCINNGQSCIAAKRFIVHQDAADEFERHFVAAMEAQKVGDPMDPETDVGPLATESIRDQVDEQVRRSVEMGARVLTGGGKVEGRGFYYRPTILTDIPPESPAYREEVFGPVALLFRAADVDDAIRLANDTEFGLGSSVWTTDEDEIRRFTDGIEAGMVFVNAMVASDPRLPFGGVKHSGYGRELGVFGIREFTNAKTVYVGPARQAPGGAPSAKSATE